MALILLFLFSCVHVEAQVMSIHKHANNGKYAIAKNAVLITDYIYNEVSEFSENKAYVAKDGDLYAYIDTNAKELTPYIFTVANDFKNGYAMIGDSFHLGMINSKMHVVVPLRFNRVLQPKLGLIVAQSEHGYWGAYDTKGNEKLPFIYDIPPRYDNLNYIIVRKNGGYGVVNDCNNILFNTSYQFILTNGIAYRSGIPLRLFEDYHIK